MQLRKRPNIDLWPPCKCAPVDSHTQKKQGERGREKNGGREKQMGNKKGKLEQERKE